MSLARAMERSGSARWNHTTAIPQVHGAARWTAGDHEAVREYLEAHEVLPGQPEAVPEDELGALSAQLYGPHGHREERKRILVFLAHHGSARAAAELQRFVERGDDGLRRFGELALEEALQHTAPAARCLGRNDPCPCASGRKFKDCCARRLT